MNDEYRKAILVSIWIWWIQNRSCINVISRWDHLVNPSLGQETLCCERTLRNAQQLDSWRIQRDFWRRCLEFSLKKFFCRRIHVWQGWFCPTMISDGTAAARQVMVVHEPKTRRTFDEASFRFHLPGWCCRRWLAGWESQTPFLGCEVILSRSSAVVATSRPRQSSRRWWRCTCKLPSFPTSSPRARPACSAPGRSTRGAC